MGNILDVVFIGSASVNAPSTHHTDVCDNKVMSLDLHLLSLYIKTKGGVCFKNLKKNTVKNLSSDLSHLHFVRTSSLATLDPLFHKQI